MKKVFDVFLATVGKAERQVPTWSEGKQSWREGGRFCWWGYRARETIGLQDKSPALSLCV